MKGHEDDLVVFCFMLRGALLATGPYYLTVLMITIGCERTTLQSIDMWILIDDSRCGSVESTRAISQFWCERQNGNVDSHGGGSGSDITDSAWG